MEIFKNTEIKMEYKQLRQIVAAYAAIPVVIFFMGWLKIYYALPLSALLIAAVFFLKKDKTEDRDSFLIIKKYELFIILCLALLWVFFSGVGGYWYQSGDFNNRNALFRDLLTKEWPVTFANPDFNNGNPFTMVYYIAFWMVPSAFGKLFMGIVGNEAMTWAFSNFILYIYTVSWIFLFFILFLMKVKAKGIKTILAGCIFLVAFSGLDVVSIILHKSGWSDHIERWTITWYQEMYQFSSLTTCLFWVFNQAIIPWCITLCILQEKKMNNLAMLGLLVLPYGPLPFVGIFIVCMTKGIGRILLYIRKDRTISILKEIFSIQNILMIIAILPVYYFFYSSNSATINGDGIQLYLMTKGDIQLTKELKYLIFFWLVEIGVYVILTLKDNWKDPNYIGAVICSIIAPLFTIGTSQTGDFTMRVSIPAILIIAVYLFAYFLKHKSDLKMRSIRRFIYIGALLIFFMGMVTPGVEFKRGIDKIAQNGYACRINDPWKTIVNEKNPFIENFVSWEPEKTIFFKYLSK